MYNRISNINNANKSVQCNTNSLRKINRAMSKYLPLTPQCVLTCKVIKDIKIGTKQKRLIANLVLRACGDEMKKIKPCILNHLYRIKVLNRKDMQLLMQHKPRDSCSTGLCILMWCMTVGFD